MKGESQKQLSRFNIIALKEMAIHEGHSESKIANAHRSSGGEKILIFIDDSQVVFPRISGCTISTHQRDKVADTELSPVEYVDRVLIASMAISILYMRPKGQSTIKGEPKNGTCCIRAADLQFCREAVLKLYVRLISLICFASFNGVLRAQRCAEGEVS